MKCYPKNDAIPVDSVQTVDNITVLTVNLDDQDMYQSHKNLPDVVTYNGQDYVKSAWNSERGKAYYRSDFAIAFAK